MWRLVINLNGGEVPSSFTSLSASPWGESTNEDLNVPHVLIHRMLDLIHLAHCGLFLVNNRVRKDTERCLSLSFLFCRGHAGWLHVNLLFLTFVRKVWSVLSRRCDLIKGAPPRNRDWQSAVRMPADSRSLWYTRTRAHTHTHTHTHAHTHTHTHAHTHAHTHTLTHNEH